jgi:hypothetical protein
MFFQLFIYNVNNDLFGLILGMSVWLIENSANFCDKCKTQVSLRHEVIYIFKYVFLYYFLTIIYIFIYGEKKIGTLLL